jgi:hypothetical protein
MRDIIVANFERTLQMLKRAIDDCPDNVWDVPDETVSIWQYAYHWSRRARLSAQTLGGAVAVQRARWAPTFARPAQEQ